MNKYWWRRFLEKLWTGFLCVVAVVLSLCWYLLLITGCVPVEITETPMPAIDTFTEGVKPSIMPTLRVVEYEQDWIADSGTAERFQEAVDYYRYQIRACREAELGAQGDTAMHFWERLQDNPELFKKSHFVKEFVWLMDNVEAKCTHTAMDDPVFVFLTLNQSFEWADEEYFQYQRQGRIGIESGDISLIESAFNHRQEAHNWIDTARFYFEELFRLY